MNQPYHRTSFVLERRVLDYIRTYNPACASEVSLYVFTQRGGHLKSWKLEMTSNQANGAWTLSTQVAPGCYPAVPKAHKDKWCQWDPTPLLENSLRCVDIFHMDSFVRQLFLFAFQGHFQSYLFIWVLPCCWQSYFTSQSQQSGRESERRNTSFSPSYLPFLPTHFSSAAGEQFHLIYISN